MICVGQNFREDSDSVHCRQWNSGINRGSGETAREVDLQLEENMMAVKRNPITYIMRISI